MVKSAKLVVYQGAPHGICSTHKDRVNQDLLAFFQEGAEAEQREFAGSNAGAR